MNGGNARAGTEQRDIEMGGVQQIDPVPAQNAGNLNLLAKGIIVDFRSKLLNAWAAAGYQISAVGRQDQKIFVFRSYGEQRFREATHVAADSRIPDSAEIKRDFHLQCYLEPLPALIASEFRAPARIFSLKAVNIAWRIA
jgi:hypothetical protein